MGEPQIVHPRAASLSLATGRIAETDLAEAARSRLDVPGLGVVEQCELQSPQRVPAVRAFRLDPPMPV